MKNAITKQEQLNARQRVRRLIDAIKDDVKIPFNYMVVGSFATGNVSLDENNKYDIDIDITFKGKELNPEETFKEFRSAIARHLRISESIKSKTRVIRINKEADFYIDIALVDYYSTPRRIITKTESGFKWMTM